MHKNTFLKALLFFHYLLLNTKCLTAQVVFEKTYDFPAQTVSAGSALPVNDGFILFGLSSDTTGPQSSNLLIRTNDSGDTVWSKLAGTYTTIRYSQMIVCADSTLKLIGRGYYNNKETPYVTEFNLSGDSLNSTAIFPYDTSLYSLYTIPTGICELADGGYIISGYRESYSGFDYVFFAMKIDSFYNTVWIMDSTTSGGQIRISDIIEASDHSILIQIEEGFGGASSPYTCILKLDSTGNKLWFKFGYHDHSLYSIAETPGHEYILCGSWFPPMTGPNPTFTGYVERLDTSGNTIWRDTNITDYYTSLCSTYNDGIAIVGYTQDSNNIRHAFLRLYDNIGQVMFHRYFSAGLKGNFNCIQVTADSGFIISGTVNNINDPQFLNTDFYLVKTDMNGNILSSINKNVISNDVLVYPNPINDRFNIKLENGNYKIRIYNSSGKLFYCSIQSGSTFTIDFNDYSSGVYFLKILNEKNSIVSNYKLVKIE